MNVHFSAVHRARPCPHPRRAGGFSLLELSVVLVIAGVLLGAVMSGADVLRSAQSQRILSEFVMGWSTAFSQYVKVARVVPGDNPLNPKNVVVGEGGAAVLCNGASPALSNIMLAKGVSLPSGRAVGQEDRYVYRDANGLPHELQACFATVPWAVAGTSVGVYVTADRHVMRLTGVTPELAMQLDTMIDGRLDARFGRLRQASRSASLSTAGAEWPPVRTASGEDNIGEVVVYLEM